MSDSALRFTRLLLTNWKNFRKAEVPLSKRMFIVGANASGKSNLLDAFRFLHDLVAVGGGLQAASGTRGGVAAIRCLAARRSSEVSIGVSVGNDSQPDLWRYELRFSQDNQKVTLIRSERVWKSGALILARPDQEDLTDTQRLTQTHLEQVNNNRAFRDVADFLSEVRYLHIVPQLIRDPERAGNHKDDPYGGDFVDRLARTPARTRNARLKRIRDALVGAVPQLTEFELRPDEGGKFHLRGRYAHWRLNGAWQTEDRFSDGTLRLIGLLWAVLDGSGPLLLEEPELSLHPEVVRQIPSMLARVQHKSDRQVLVSTHSVDMFQDDGVQPSEVLLLSPEVEGTTIGTIQSNAMLADLAASKINLGDIVSSLTRPTELHLFDTIAR